jgi:hypothetical protein
MADDPYNNLLDAVSNPARRTAAVTTHNTNPLPVGAAKALYVGSAGDVKLRAVDDEGDTTFKNVQAGTILPVRALYVRTTSTRAANMVALY